MSKMQVTSCDGCNEMAPADYNTISPSKGRVHLRVRFHEFDACSWVCLATIVAARIAGLSTRERRAGNGREASPDHCGTNG